MEREDSTWAIPEFSPTVSKEPHGDAFGFVNRGNRIQLGGYLGQTDEDIFAAHPGVDLGQHLFVGSVIRAHSTLQFSLVFVLSALLHGQFPTQYSSVFWMLALFFPRFGQDTVRLGGYYPHGGVGSQVFRAAGARFASPPKGVRLRCSPPKGVRLVVLRLVVRCLSRGSWWLSRSPVSCPRPGSPGQRRGRRIPNRSKLPRRSAVKSKKPGHIRAPLGYAPGVCLR